MREVDLDWLDIDGIGVICVFGLVGVLLVGLIVVKILVIVYEKFFVGVYYLEGYIYVVYLS